MPRNITQKGSPTEPNDLALARSLLADDPPLAQTHARAILKTSPGHAEASFILGAALRRSGDPKAARQILEPLAMDHPKAWGLQFEAGVAAACLGETGRAITFLKIATALNPASSLAWHALGDQLEMVGDEAGAQAAHAKPLAGSLSDPSFMAAAQAFFDDQGAAARTVLKTGFNLHLCDMATIRLLSDAGLRLGYFEAVEHFLEAQRALAPGFLPLRLALAMALQHQGKTVQALAEAKRLLELAPDSVAFQTLNAALLAETGDVHEAAALYASALETHPFRSTLWVRSGHCLKAIGRQEDALAAYRRALALEPTLGEAYWSLANLKVARFEAAEVQAMQGLLDLPDGGGKDRASLHFALAKALEDRGHFEKSFAHYRQGNSLRRVAAPYDPDANHDYVKRTIETFTAEFFANRTDVGNASSEPIFIVGLPRSGSTLIEQVLSSHSGVEGASELPVLTSLARKLAQALSREDQPPYPASLAELQARTFETLGEQYLTQTQAYRKLARSRFVDKFPSNFMHIGLIHLILPRAKIIDVRRDPMACCLSGFKQNFAQGQHYSYDLTDLGRYYADYLALMNHFDQVLPQRMHHIQYEAMVENTDDEIRRLLEYCNLEFEPSCLRFYETSRPIRTASSEQVRRPIFKEGVNHWRNFEPWLDPLKAALGRAIPSERTKTEP